MLTFYALRLQALVSQELMGNRQRKNFHKLFRKYSKVKQISIDWYVASSMLLNVEELSKMVSCHLY